MAEINSESLLVFTFISSCFFITYKSKIQLRIASSYVVARLVQFHLQKIAGKEI